MRSTTAIASALGVAQLLIPKAEVLAGSGKHIPPMCQFARQNVRTPADAWAVVNLTYDRIACDFSVHSFEALKDDADLMRDALSWLYKHRREVFASGQMEAGETALNIADGLVESAHDSVHRRKLGAARQYVALLRAALRQIELNEAESNPLRAGGPKRIKRGS